MALNSVDASKRHRNQTKHYDKQRRVLMANSAQLYSCTAASLRKPIDEPRWAKPKAYHQAPTRLSSLKKRPTLSLRPEPP